MTDAEIFAASNGKNRKPYSTHPAELIFNREQGQVVEFDDNSACWQSHSGEFIQLTIDEFQSTHIRLLNKSA